MASFVEELLDEVHRVGWLFTLHSDGDISEILPDIVAMGVDILNPLQSECMDVLG